MQILTEGEVIYTDYRRKNVGRKSHLLAIVKALINDLDRLILGHVLSGQVLP